MNPLSLSPLLDFVLAYRPALAPLIADQTELQTLANLLPCLPCAGLELRLAPGEASITDLQLGLCSPADMQRLRDWYQQKWLAAAQPLPNSWAILGQALDDWPDDIPIRELWLELDGGSDLPWPPLSLFIGLDLEAGSQQLESQLRTWLEKLDAAISSPMVAGLQRCLAACQGPQRPSHVGWMPGRSGSALRLIIEGCTWETDTEFLARAGWSGDPDTWRNTLLPLQTDIDRWRLAISLREDGSIAPTVGLECFVGHTTTHDPRWAQLLQQGMQQGWWSATTANALSTWPGQFSPATVRSAWPDALMIDALIDGDDPPATLNLRISHVKLLCDGQKLGGAKGYVGFARVRPAISQRLGNLTITRAEPATTVPEATENGLQFLLRCRSPSGWWQDYDGFSEGISDEWVSAFVASALLASRLPAGLPAASRAWSLLAARGRCGWGWNAVQPPDADSTAWALRLAFALGHDNDKMVKQGLAFLSEHLVHDGAATGGVTTYDRLHHAAAGGDPGCQPSWFEPHDCVTAAVANLAITGGQNSLRDTVSYLHRQQRANGEWLAYWWLDPAYATACATQSLANDPYPASRNACRKAAVWARSSLARGNISDLAPFSLALRLQVLMQALEPTDAGLLDQGCRQLLATQLFDGSWPAGARLTIPNSRDQVVPALDNRRAITTAVVVQTLALLPVKGLQ
jgi:squalene-hopene/tetraprenyl-beta-curcumene cyclase